MSGPDFIDLVGDEGSQEELEQLRRAHDLLLAAGPPPELSPRIREAPAAISKKTRVPQRRRFTAVVIAVGLVAAGFGVGLVVADKGSEQAAPEHVYPMHPPSGTGAARASVALGEKDSVGNWPLVVQVSGLKTLPKGQWYELYLVRAGKIAGWCGSFNVKEEGRTTVSMTVPYVLKRGDQWVVTQSKGSPEPPWLLTT